MTNVVVLVKCFNKGKQIMTEIMKKEDYIKDLQSLLQFVNSNPMVMKPHELAGLAHLYCMLAADKHFDSRLIDFTEHYLKFTQSLDPTPTLKALSDIRRLFSEIRTHTTKIIQGIIDGVADEKEFEIKCDASMGIRLKVINGKIEGYYTLFDKGPKEKLSLTHEKNKISILLLNITSALGSDIMRIKKCKKDGCETFFWQPTKRPKNYCSQKCAGAVRQKKYMNGKTDK